MGGNILYLAEVLYIYKNSLHPYYDIIKMHCTSHYCQIIINLYILNTEVPYIYQNSLHPYYDIIKCTKLYILQISQKDVLSPDVLSLWTFCPHGRYVCRMFCPAGRFVPTDI